MNFSPEVELEPLTLLTRETFRIITTRFRRNKVIEHHKESGLKANHDRDELSAVGKQPLPARATDRVRRHFGPCRRMDHPFPDSSGLVGGDPICLALSAPRRRRSHAPAVQKPPNRHDTRNDPSRFPAARLRRRPDTRISVLMYE